MQFHCAVPVSLRLMSVPNTRTATHSHEARGTCSAAEGCWYWVKGFLIGVVQEQRGEGGGGGGNLGVYESSNIRGIYYAELRGVAAVIGGKTRQSHSLYSAGVHCERWVNIQLLKEVSSTNQRV